MLGNMSDYPEAIGEWVRLKASPSVKIIRALLLDPAAAERLSRFAPRNSRTTNAYCCSETYRSPAFDRESWTFDTVDESSSATRRVRNNPAGYKRRHQALRRISLLYRGWILLCKISCCLQGFYRPTRNHRPWRSTLKRLTLTAYLDCSSAQILCRETAPYNSSVSASRNFWNV